MNKIADKHSFFDGFIKFIFKELAPSPRRIATFIHYIVSAVFIIIVSISLDVKFLTISLLISFMLTMDNSKNTAKTCISVFFATFFIYGLAFLLLAQTFDFPLIRIVFAFSIVFLGMYLFRISPLGQIGYMMAVFIVYTQAMYDAIPDPETLTRTILWSWIALIYSLAVVFFVNIWIKPINPQDVIFDESIKCLDLAIKQIELKINQEPFKPLDLYDLENSIKSLNSSIKFSNKEYGTAEKATIFGIIQEIIIITNRISKYETDKVENLPDLKKLLEDLKQAIENNSDFSIDKNLKFNNPDFKQLFDVLLFFANSKVENIKEKSSVFVVDAFINPKYSRFAFKTMLATFLCYAFYKATAWDGIYTCMLTCLIVALPSLGDIKQKSALRLLGCSIGGILTILAVVFVLPHCESIVGFLLVSISIIGLGAWIATGSKRINYAGWQLAFAYILPVCATYDLSTDLVNISDRLIGIFVGVIVTIFIHANFWPEIKSRDISDDYEELINLANEKKLQNLFSKIRSFQEAQTELVLNENWTCETTSNGKIYPINKIYNIIK